MFLELHILQNFAPANLNRDDTGSPKDCEFGGYRRARVSSQSWKRAMRESFNADVKPGLRGFRTKLIVEACSSRMTSFDKEGDQTKSPEENEEIRAGKRKKVVEVALEACRLSVEDGRTESLLFVGELEVAELASICDKHAATLWTAVESRAAEKEAAAKEAEAAAAANPDDRSKAKPKRKAQKQAELKLDKDATKDLGAWLHKGRGAIDVALFGRMLADIPKQNVEAASQVAHAISTNRLAAEFDYYTAVDDLKPEETTGAGHIGTLGFNSACFYRYLNLDFEQLKKNLGGDTKDEASKKAAHQAATEAARSWATAAIHSIPTGKQNSMAAQNPPFFVLAVVRAKGLWSLTNAFIDPVRPLREADLATGSVNALVKHWGQLATMYGGADGFKISTSSLLDAKLTTEFGAPVPVAKLIEQSTNALVA